MRSPRNTGSNTQDFCWDDLGRLWDELEMMYGQDWDDVGLMSGYVWCFSACV